MPGLVISPYARRGYIDHQVLSSDAYLKFIEDDFLGAARLDPATDGRPDPRPDVREDEPVLGQLSRDFDFSQPPRAPVLLATNPPTDSPAVPPGSAASRPAPAAPPRLQPARAVGRDTDAARLPCPGLERAPGDQHASIDMGTRGPQTARMGTAGTACRRSRTRYILTGTRGRREDKASYREFPWSLLMSPDRPRRAAADRLAGPLLGMLFVRAEVASRRSRRGCG